MVITSKNIITNLTSENYIGIAADTYADNEDSTIGIVGCIDRNQTSLTAGQQYFVRADGINSYSRRSFRTGCTAISATELVVKRNAIGETLPRRFRAKASGAITVENL